MLDKEVEELDSLIEERVRAADGVTLSFDSWTNIRKEQLMAIVIALADEVDKRVSAH